MRDRQLMSASGESVDASHRDLMCDVLHLLDQLERQTKGTQQRAVRNASQALRWVIREILDGDA